MNHLNYGLRTEGGIGEQINKITYDEGRVYFVGRFFFEILFYIVVIVVLLSIVFGIIIDTFAELREKSHHVENDKINNCFICGAKREALDKEKGGYENHVNHEHNLWTYAEYIIGLKFVDRQETNATNSHVIEQIEQNSIYWLPAHVKNKEDEE